MSNSAEFSTVPLGLPHKQPHEHTAHIGHPSQPPSPLQDELTKAVFAYGDRPSSFITLYPKFRSYAASDNHYYLRYVTANNFNIVANEPLAPAHKRGALFEAFARKNKQNKMGTLMMPVSRALAWELVKKKYYAYPVGVEPVFNLQEYLSKDPLLSMPLARALKKKGAIVAEVSHANLTAELKAQIEQLTKEWLAAKQNPLGFLNQVDPLHLIQHKRLFTLSHHGKLVAFLSAVPIPQKNSYFFADYIRAPHAKAGAIELLFIQAMMLLSEQGVAQVSFGLCPLAKVKPLSRMNLRVGLWTKAARFIFNHITTPYSFSNIYRFKKKFNPSYWQPHYAVFDRPVNYSVLRALTHAYVPGGYINHFLQKSFPKFTAKMNQATHVTAGACSVAVVGLCLLLHILRSVQPASQKFYETYTFRAADFNILGWLVGPFFHTNAYHLWGDMASYLFFGIMLERLTGAWFAAAIAAVGLWLSNPVAIALLLPLKFIAPELWFKTINEADYGSSNAVYAFVGALAAGLVHPRILFIPFALNGLYLCLARQSLLSLHHLTALLMGYTLSKLALQRLAKQEERYKNLSTDQ